MPNDLGVWTAMAGRLAGKVCVITGTGGSMGRAAALTFARSHLPGLIESNATPEDAA
jgi:NAD(P)-dependent dehydrogenase (short-subunit alcohol dehydrogenase family)